MVAPGNSAQCHAGGTARSNDRTARVWEAASGRLFTTLARHTNTMWNVAWSPKRIGRSCEVAKGDSLLGSTCDAQVCECSFLARNFCHSA